MKNLLFLFILLFIGSLNGQGVLKPEMTPKTNTVVPFSVDPYITLIKGCDDKLDVLLRFKPIIGQDKNTKSKISAHRISITPSNKLNRSKDLYLNNGFEAEFYGLEESSDSRIDFNVKAYDIKNRLILNTTIGKSTLKDGHVEVSEKLFAMIYDMGHEETSRGANSSRGPGDDDDVFTYFCGRQISKIELLAFYQDFLGLSSFELCEMIKEFDRQNIEYQESGSITWTGEYCELLNSFWGIYVSGGTLPTGTCECKVINSSVFVDHSVGETTGTELEDCPDVSVTNGYKIYSHDSNSSLNYTNSNRNWGIFAWTKMGASKGMYSISHHYDGNDDNSGVPLQLKETLNNTDLKSGIQFSMKCFDPYDAVIDTACDCSKEILIDAQYVSEVAGRASTDGNIFSSGNGKVKSCMEDFAFLTKFSREGGEIIQGNGALSCVECSSTDTTNFLTDIGTLASGIEDIVPTVAGGFDLSKIDDYFNAAGSTLDLFSDFINTPDCNLLLDETYNLIDTFDTYVLTPKNDYVSYVVSSKLVGWTDFENDESVHQLKLVSDYYLAGGLVSSGDSSCCNEKVGGYTIGHVGDFSYSFLATITNDNVDFDGHSLKINDPLKSVGIELENSTLFSSSPNSLSRLQRDVAQLFTLIHPNFLKDVFGLDCGPGCSVSMDCYYNCGYYGECHNELGENFVNEEDVELRFKKTSDVNDVKVFPNPASDNDDINIQFGKEVYSELLVFDITGKLILRINIDPPQDEIRLSMNSLDKGLNILMLKAQDGSIFVEKILKQ
jgi:hypothetical protein